MTKKWHKITKKWHKMTENWAKTGQIEFRPGSPDRFDGVSVGYRSGMEKIKIYRGENLSIIKPPPRYMCSTYTHYRMAG